MHKDSAGIDVGTFHQGFRCWYLLSTLWAPLIISYQSINTIYLSIYSSIYLLNQMYLYGYHIFTNLTRIRVKSVYP